MSLLPPISLFFFFNDTATTEIYTLSLHDALPICKKVHDDPVDASSGAMEQLFLSYTAKDMQKELEQRKAVRETVKEQLHKKMQRSEEHTSELQSPCNLVCRLLLEKKKTRIDAVHG